MNKTDLKNFAVSARVELLSRVRDRAALYGITEEKCRTKAVAPSDTFQKLGGGMLSRHEAAQREALLAQIRRKGFPQVMEEAAYTWFNRFIALKYMEEHRLLPIEQRVMPEKAGEMPQIVREAQRVELDGLALDQVIQMLEENHTEELYKALLMALCNQLSAALPQMFEQIADYTELLFPGGILKAESVLGMMAKLNSPEDNNWADIQVIGWLYQYYNTELKQETFDLLKKNVKITKERIGAATQLFTPEWIVNYMVENSLGRLWLEGHPDHSLQDQWRYYLEEAKQEPEVETQLAAIRKERASLQPEQITVLDPCMGSGHILVYAFDVLMTIYRSVGYTDRDAVESIITNNLYGLDIDDRAAQLAYFSLMMKACEYDRRFLRRGLQPHVYAIQESQNIVTEDLACFGALKQQALDLYHTFVDAKEYGSILQVPLTTEELEALSLACDRLMQEAETSRLLDIAAMHRSCALAIQALLPQAITLARKYDAVITNPPYMGASGMGDRLSKYVKDNYPDSKSDLFAVFMERCRESLKENGYQAMITQHAWMFLSSYERLRVKLQSVTLINMAHLGARAFEEIGGEVVQTAAFVMQNCHTPAYTGLYARLIEPTTQQGKEDMFLAGQNRYTARQDNFSKIPGAPVAYWVSKAVFNSFDNVLLAKYAISNGQNITGNNDLFLRLFWEVNSENINKYYWAKCARGGGYRKNYGNDIYVILWTQAAKEHYKKDSIARIIPEQLRFKDGITWSYITSSIPSFRKLWPYELFEKAGTSVFIINNNYLYPLLGLLNSIIALKFLNIINPTLNYQVRDIFSMPVAPRVLESKDIPILVDQNINLCRNDWDSFETSWDFQRHPLI